MILKKIKKFYFMRIIFKFVIFIAKVTLKKYYIKFRIKLKTQRKNQYFKKSWKLKDLQMYIL